MSDGLPRLLVAGVGPLPPERPGRQVASGLRLWGLARELAKTGHRVRLICAGEEGAPRARRYDLAWAPREEPHLPEARPLELSAGGWPDLLARESADFYADAALGSGLLMNHALATAQLEIPLWLDFSGDPLAERQMLSLGRADDDGLLTAWGLLAPVLVRADRLSACSGTHCAALLGQLGAVGRLNRLSARERLVRCIPPWAEPIPIDIDCEAIVRGSRVPQDAFLIVQTGAFDAWLDTPTLFAALECVMAADPRVHFAASGGAMPGQPAGGFEWFSEQVNNSVFNERYHLLGWLPLGQVPRLIGEGDLGLNVDLECTQGVLGTRYRLLDWIGGGLPVISTPGCELARDLGNEELIALAPHGAPEALAHVILEKIAEPVKARRAMAERAARWLRAENTPEASLGPLLEWAATPQLAADVAAWMAGRAEPPALMERMLQAVAPETGIQSEGKKPRKSLLETMAELQAQADAKAEAVAEPELVAEPAPQPKPAPVGDAPEETAPETAEKPEPEAKPANPPAEETWTTEAPAAGMQVSPLFADLFPEEPAATPDPPAAPPEPPAPIPAEPPAEAPAPRTLWQRLREALRCPDE